MSDNVVAVNFGNNAPENDLQALGEYQLPNNRITMQQYFDTMKSISLANSQTGLTRTHRDIYTSVDILQSIALNTYLDNSDIVTAVVRKNIKTSRVMVNAKAKDSEGMGLYVLSCDYGNVDLATTDIPSLECDVDIIGTTGIATPHILSMYRKLEALCNEVGGYMFYFVDNEHIYKPCEVYGDIACFVCFNIEPDVSVLVTLNFEGAIAFK